MMLNTIRLLLALGCGFHCLISVMAQEDGKPVVLVLAHGGSSTWQTAVSDAVQPLEEMYPVVMAFGMADPVTIQQGLDELKQRAVNEVIVVPLFISSHSPIIRQTEYLLGIRKELADEPMLDHGHDQEEGGEHNNHDAGSKHQHSASQGRLQPLRTESRMIMAHALDDHPVVADILVERILELSHQPDQETIVLVAHGANGESDNRKWVKSMERISDQIRNLFNMKSGARFRNIFCLTVRDDADTNIYNQAKEHLRAVVRQAGKDGEVLVIPLYLSHGGVERDIVTRLEGLKYEWTGRTLLPDDRITEFIRHSVLDALRNP